MMITWDLYLNKSLNGLGRKRKYHPVLTPRDTK